MTAGYRVAVVGATGVVGVLGSTVGAAGVAEAVGPLPLARIFARSSPTSCETSTIRRAGRSYQSKACRMESGAMPRPLR